MVHAEIPKFICSATSACFLVFNDQVQVLFQKIHKIIPPGIHIYPIYILYYLPFHSIAGTDRGAALTADTRQQATLFYRISSGHNTEYDT